MPRSSAPEAAIVLLQAQMLAAIPWLRHGFSTRQDDPAGADFDLATSRRNQRRFARAVFGEKTAPPLQLRQIHSALVWNMDDPALASDAPPRAGDAMIGTSPGRLLAVRTADCCPILLVDLRHRAVAAVHAGWRGTLARVVEKAVGEMRAAFSTDPADLRAAIGPCIRSCCYEVGDEIRQAFSARFAYADALFRDAEDDPIRNRYPMLFMTGAPPGHPYDPRWNPSQPLRLDLVQANLCQLHAAGVAPAAVEVLPQCTACHPERFFSHRRGATGRLLSAIGLSANG